ncbi:hypothetical protein AHF37_11331 [Paragonimus kellicotti]|nr:hypothetical protein AHF37_11331 [Paragonimus kellicotti]
MSEPDNFGEDLHKHNAHDKRKSNSLEILPNSESCNIPEWDELDSPNISSKTGTGWLRCHGCISQEQVRKQLHRSKSRIEEHVCHPWLRRLIFHLSHYFPNLHDTTHTTSNRRVKVTTVDRPSTYQVGRRQMTTQTKVSQRKTVGASESADIVRQTTPDNCSPVPKKALDDQKGKVCLTSGPTGYEAKRYPNTKRRPLQRQKSSGIADFEQYFAVPSQNEEPPSTK